MNRPRPAWFVYPIGALTLFALVAVVVAVALAPDYTTVFSDTERLEPTQPPAARNDCEREFASRLTDDLGVPAAPVPTPPAEDVEAVMNACTADQLLTANAYFAFPAGQPMTYLMHRRLFNGPDQRGQLEALCAERPELSSTTACGTLAAFPP